MLIVNAITHDRGWSRIQHMVAIAQEFFGCEVVQADRRSPSIAAQIQSILHQRSRIAAGDELRLLIFLAAWIIDSFWLEYIPRSIRLRNPFIATQARTPTARGSHFQARSNVIAVKDPIALFPE